MLGYNGQWVGYELVWVDNSVDLYLVIMITKKGEAGQRARKVRNSNNKGKIEEKEKGQA